MLKSALLWLVLMWFSSAYATEPKIQVQLSGVPEGQTELLLSGLSIFRQQSSNRLTENRVTLLHKSAENELKTMLEVYGYYHPDIHAELKQENEQWFASYQVTLNQQIMVSHIEIDIIGQAKQDDAFTDLVADFPLKKGDAFTHENYEASKKKLLKLGAGRGYFDGELLNHEVYVNTDENSARIYLKWQSGVRYVFDDIIFPDTVLNTTILKQLSPIQAGDAYTAKQVVKLRSNLNDSGYFKSVAVSSRINERHDGKVPLDITLEPEAKHLYTAGLGFGTDSGVRGSLGWENRYVNKRGHSLITAANLSLIRNSLTADYNIPFGYKSISSLGFNAALKQENSDVLKSQSYTIGGYYKTERWGWDETGSLKLLNENFEVSQVDASTQLLIPSITWSKKWADDTVYTRQGARVSLTLSAASESLLSDVSFFQSTLSGKYITSLSDSSRLITRGSIGATEVSDFSRLPSSLRYFTGGDNTVRGYKFQSLGPVGNDGSVEGGAYLAVGSVEYENMLWGDWGAAVFSDFGNAFNEWSDPIEYTAGIGARWRSPIGLIRIDVAKSISDSNESIGLHLVIGPDL